MPPRLGWWALIAMVVTGCAGEPSAVSPEASGDAEGSAVIRGEPAFTVRLDDAVVLTVASNGVDQPALAWTTSEEVRVSRLDLTSGGLIDEVEVSGDVTPFAHPIERPSLAVLEGGAVDVAFPAAADGGGSIYHTRFSGEEVPEPRIISGSPSPETNLVHATTAPDGSVVLAWLEDSTLSVATEREGELVETEQVDHHTCDCCNPAPVHVGESLVVAFRDFDELEGEVIRDVALVRSSDGGSTFVEPVPVADEHWFISGCPFTGPSAVVVDGELIVAWMDARQSLHPHQLTSTIWVDVSSDEGISFGPDLAVADDAIHRWPVMAVDGSGTVHLVWETQGEEGGLSYAYSTDRGRSFSSPTPIVTAAEGSGSPRSPSIAYHDQHLIVTWADDDGGHVAVWSIDA